MERFGEPEEEETSKAEVRQGKKVEIKNGVNMIHLLCTQGLFGLYSKHKTTVLSVNSGIVEILTLTGYLILARSVVFKGRYSSVDI